ncbi:MAG: Txe/YoeB family addiction module toxin [Syntrophomonadaceae bacterium]|nr:Txe/YoeB family addiction module toxin [Syntrophomonadaceae bacterium]MDD3022982.1 Txe/YoeB family addiction module toxin [Syntrophomonadaceae bacterium]
MNKIFTNTAWQEYLYWQNENRQILKRINELIKDIERNGNMGIGKPEPLRHELSGFWSRRINNEHRLIYSIEGNNINIISCLGHY